MSSLHIVGHVTINMVAIVKANPAKNPIVSLVLFRQILSFKKLDFVEFFLLDKRNKRYLIVACGDCA